MLHNMHELILDAVRISNKVSRKCLSEIMMSESVLNDQHYIESVSSKIFVTL